MSLKQYINRKRNTAYMPSYENLMDKINNYENVSFDIFDTLLKRNIKEPTDVFDIVQRYVGREYPNFKIKRIEAERKARSKSLKEEVTLEDIYKEYPEEDMEKLDFLQSAEMKVEQEILTVNPYMYDIYEECVRKNKKIYIISDMYLPKEFIMRVLKKNNIKNYQKLYVSCEVDKTKKSGSLFKYYLDENGIDPRTAIHIGDSWKSDFYSPKNVGMNAIHIPLYIKNEVNIYGVNSIETNYLSSFVNNKYYENDDKYYKFGYQKLGPFLWGYVTWLYKNMNENNIKKVYFFSRDGYIMKKVYDLLYSNKSIKSYYLEVSRRSLRVPILWFDSSFSTILGMVSPSKRVSLQAIFDCVGLNIHNYSKLLAKYDFNENDSFDRKNIEKNKRLKQLYSELQEDINKTSQEEYKYMIRYLSQQKVNDKFAIVDIGWSGGMQRFLEQTLDKLHIEHEIYGYYIGVANYYTRNEKVHPLNLQGYLFDFKNKVTDKDKRSSFVGLFETLFLEQGGSVQKYIETFNNEIVSKRAPYEYIINGKESFEYEAVKCIQEGALEFIKDVKMNNFMFNQINFTADDLFEGLRKTGQDPTWKDIEMFGDFNFYDEGEKEFLAKPNSLIYYIFNLKKLKSDFLSSRWKTGFLKRLLKIKLPYESIYEWMLRFK